MTERTLAVCLAVAACSLGTASCNSLDHPSGASGANGAVVAARAEVTIRQQLIEVELARSREEQARGLSERDSLAWGRGMLFPYEQPAFVSFWMKGMRFDIDIVWIRENHIVGIAEWVPHPPSSEGTPVSVPSPELIDTVLEVPAGYAQAHGWSRGDRVRVSSLEAL